MPPGAAVKQSRSQGGSRSHQRYPSTLQQPEEHKYKIVRYELKPRLTFPLEHRHWYPVEQAWQIYNYDKSYLCGLQIERLESLQKERDYALNMMKSGNHSYWRMVRDAEIGMFGHSPEFGGRGMVGRVTPLLGRGRAELLSSQARRGRSARFQALDGFKPRGHRMHVSVEESAQVCPQNQKTIAEDPKPARAAMC